MSIESLTQEEAITIVRHAAKLAEKEKNLDIVLGSNGMSGRNATGNYSLLAKATGLSRVHIGKVLKGKVEPSHKTLRALADVTGLTMDAISMYVRRAA